MVDEKKKKEPPDIGKGSEVDEGSLSPDIGKGEELDESQDEFDETIVPPEPEEGTGGPLSAETQEYLKGKGFKSADELVKSHESLEKKQTDLTRDARLNRLGGPYVPAPAVERPAGSLTREKIEIPDDPSELLYDKEKFKTFLDNYGNQVEARTLEKVDAHLGQQEEQRILAEYNSLLSEDPDKFEKLRPMMFQLSKRYPNAAMQDLYAEADVHYQKQKKEASSELLKDVFGPDVDASKIKTLVSKMKPATISSSSGGGQEIPVTVSSTVRERAKTVKEEILGATKLTD